MAGLAHHRRFHYHSKKRRPHTHGCANGQQVALHGPAETKMASRDKQIFSIPGDEPAVMAAWESFVSGDTRPAEALRPWGQAGYI